MHIVELQHSAAVAAKIVAAIRKWLESGNAQPTIRYSLLGGPLRVWSSATVPARGTNSSSNSSNFGISSGAIMATPVRDG